jgi:hypothetical protein
MKFHIAKNLPKGSLLPGNENRTLEERLAVALKNALDMSRGQFRALYRVNDTYQRPEHRDKEDATG